MYEWLWHGGWCVHSSPSSEPFPDQCYSTSMAPWGPYQQKIWRTDCFVFWCVIKHILCNVLMRKAACSFTKAFSQQKWEWAFAGESNLVVAWAVHALAQITPFSGNTRMSWRTNLVEKQLHWHRRRAPSRGEDMNLGWAEGRIQQWWLKASVQAELKRSGSNMSCS